MKCKKCEYATYKPFGVYCEVMGIPILNDEDLKYCKKDETNEK